jgi:hypothetical protein
MENSNNQSFCALQTEFLPRQDALQRMAAAGLSIGPAVEEIRAMGAKEPP